MSQLFAKNEMPQSITEHHGAFRSTQRSIVRGVRQIHFEGSPRPGSSEDPFKREFDPSKTVPGAGLEPAWPRGPGGLSPLRLPFRHPGQLCPCFEHPKVYDDIAPLGLGPKQTSIFLFPDLDVKSITWKYGCNESSRH